MRSASSGTVPLSTEMPNEGRTPGSPRDRQPPMAAAMRWVALATNIGFEMAAPALLGWWLDSLWGTEPWLLIVGACLGLTTALLHLVRLANASQREHNKRIRGNGNST